MRIALHQLVTTSDFGVLLAGWKPGSPLAASDLEFVGNAAIPKY
jgi:hypothetical protein